MTEIIEIKKQPYTPKEEKEKTQDIQPEIIDLKENTVDSDSSSYPGYKNAAEEIVSLIRARVPIIWVITHEEGRFIQDFTNSIASPTNRKVWIWSQYQGLVEQNQQLSTERATGEQADTWHPQKALNRITKMVKDVDSKGICFILRDFHTVLGEPVPRQIRDMYDHLIRTGKTLVITSPMLAHGIGGTKPGLSPTLEKQLAIVRYDLPSREDIHTHVEQIIDHMKTSTQGKRKNTKLDYSEEEISSIVKALQGLTLLEIDNSISASISHLNRIDPEKLLLDKKQLLRKSEILEFIQTPININEVGGLDMVKDYLGKYSRAYTKEAKEYGVEPLKGILLTGVPGTGKSLLAKAIGRLWKVPLLRLDVGKVMTGLVGGSESKMRDVIKQTEAMSPCVLWIDEVEKSLAGTKSSNFSDGGTLARVFGTLLTAMQDGMEGVTIIATANDITMLPPEFIRRFNEVFFVDLPGPEERWEIFAIHLKKRNRDIEKFANHKQVFISSTKDFTGAEIEKAIKDGIAASFYEDKKDLTFNNLLKAIAGTKPIAKVMANKVTKLRNHAKGSFRFASSYAAEQSMNNKNKNKSKNKNKGLGKKLDIDEVMDEISPPTESSDKSIGNTDRFLDL